MAYAWYDSFLFDQGFLISKIDTEYLMSKIS